MLVLRRKVDEKIIIRVPGVGNIEITVCYLQPNGKTVQIGVDAPRDCEIDRD